MNQASIMTPGDHHAGDPRNKPAVVQAGNGDHDLSTAVNEERDRERQERHDADASYCKQYGDRLFHTHNDPKRRNINIRLNRTCPYAAKRYGHHGEVGFYPGSVSSQDL